MATDPKAKAVTAPQNQAANVLTETIDKQKNKPNDFFQANSIFQKNYMLLGQAHG